MIDREKLREQFMRDPTTGMLRDPLRGCCATPFGDAARPPSGMLRDPLPRHLGGLAATLGRISSSAMKSSDPEIVSNLIDEASWLIEWTAGEAEPEAAAELVHIQILLTVWKTAWVTACQNPHERLLLSLRAKDWSDKAVDFSGLVKPIFRTKK